MNKKWKVIYITSKVAIGNISRYECDIFSYRIEHLAMIDRAEYISHLLIREIIDTCSCDIPYDSDFPDKVKSDTIQKYSCLTGGSYRRSRTCIKWYPPKCTTMTKSLYKS